MNARLVSAPWLLRFLRWSIVLNLLVMLAGSVVRMTGSGMGCPDWPKCFGLAVPPTRVEQVTWSPSGTYAQGQMVLHDGAFWVAQADHAPQPAFSAELWQKFTRHDYATFNPVHTWIEFINRLLGVLLGIPVLLAAALSARYVRSHPWWLITMLGVLFTLAFEAWLGKVVVDGNLVPHHITYHMLGAYVLLALLTVLFRNVHSLAEQNLWRSEPPAAASDLRPLILGFATLAGLLLVQTVLGTSVREGVDELVHQWGFDAPRDGWVGQLEPGILIHRSFSLLLLGLAYWLYRRSAGLAGLRARAGLVLLILSAEAAVGATLFYLDLPRSLQPVHLLLSAAAWMVLVDAVAKAGLMLRAIRASRGSA
ncbi:MAG: COX15/CtaA family protein [Schleiferiaceae bacterium]